MPPLPTVSRRPVLATYAARCRVIRAAQAAAVGILLILGMAHAHAELPIDVQKATAEGDHVTALARFSRLSRSRITPGALLAAARSAWALSLLHQADELFARALQQRGLQPEERSEVVLSRGVISFQEGKYEVARHYAQQLLNDFSPSPAVEARGRVLLAEALFELGEHATAAQEYEQALKVAASELQGGIRYRLGLCELRLGKSAAAISRLEQVPLTHPDAPAALRTLAEATYWAGRYADAQFWIEAGRARFPDKFIESWNDFMLIRAILEQGKPQKAREALTAAEQRFGPGDPWITLARATLAAKQAAGRPQTAAMRTAATRVRAGEPAREQM